MRRGVATFTLDYGKCPPWLFERMVKLGREMTRVLIEEYGPDEFIRRIGDPVWFQSLGTVLAFDWNASGLTTILTAALKEAIREREKDWGIFIAGGKGKTSRKTPDQIIDWGEKLSLPEKYAQNLVYNSKMSAKVDSSLVQDGYDLYHHAFFFTRNGAWAVVQQGMNKENRTARRYHWSSNNAKDLIKEPHSGIASQAFHRKTLNMTSDQSDATRMVSVDLLNGGYVSLMKDIEILRKHSSELSRMIALRKNQDEFIFAELARREFKYHPVIGENFNKSKYLEKILGRLVSEKPRSYEQMLATPGVGPKTIRALALVSEVLYGAPPSYKDPARYSFAHGGKDATPYPVDRKTYDATIQTLRAVVGKTRWSPIEKIKVLNKLHA
jgi:hypothetical protein